MILSLSATDTLRPSHFSSFGRFIFFLFSISLSFINPDDSHSSEKLPLESLHHRNFISFTPGPLQSLDGDTVTNILIREDRDVWISTSDKTFRFDGNTLNHVPIQERKEPSFPESQFESIIETSVGEIFLVSFDGIVYKYFGGDNIFHPQNLDNFNFSYGKEVRTSHLDDKDTIWLGYSDGTVAKFNTNLQSYSHIESSAQNAIISILRKNSNTYFVEESGGILRLNDYGEIDYVHSSCGQPASPFSVGILDNHGNILLGTKGDGIWRLNPWKAKCKIVKAFKNSQLPISTATVHEISHARYDGIDLTLISTDSGVFVTHENNVLTALNRSNSGIRSNEVLSAVHVDDFAVWLGTYSGLRVLKKTNVEFISDFPNNRSPSIVATTSSTTLGTFVADYKHIYKLHSGKRLKKIDEIRLSSHSGSGIMSMAASEDRLWIGFRNGHLLLYNPETGIQREHSIDSDQQRIPPISSIYIINENKAYIGTFGGGVYVFQEGKITNLSSKNQRNPEYVLQIKRLTKIGIIAFSESSINIIDYDGENRTYADSKLDIFKNYPIWSVDENEHSTWLVTPKDGVYVLRNHTKDQASASQIIPDEFLSDLIIYGVRLEKSGIAYLSSNRGIFKANADGMFQRELQVATDAFIVFDYGAVGSDYENNILFGGTGGLVRIINSKKGTMIARPKLNFTKLSVNGLPRQFAGSISNTSHLAIKYPSKVLTVQYSVMDFSSPQEFKYRYKLHPFDPDWIDGGSNGSATYTNIPPGDYVFHVQGANSAGVWNREGITMNVRVLPPPWRTWWAYCLYAVGLYLALFMGKKWYDANVLREKATEIAREKTWAADAALNDMHEKLESQDSFVRNVRQRNVATLNTVDNMISHRADFLPDDVSADIMRSSGRHVHALALLERSLKYYNDRLFADLNAFTADCLAELCLEHENSHTVTTINDVTDELVPADDATQIALIIFELLHNAFLHAFPEDTVGNYLRITMACTSAQAGSMQIELKVQDNGVGMPEGVAGELHGISMVQKIVQRYDGTMEMTSAGGSSITIALQIPSKANA